MVRQKASPKAFGSFLDLVRAFPLRPIRTKADYEAAARTLRHLVGSRPESEFPPDERDYLETLTLLVQDYQQKQTRQRSLRQAMR